MADWIQRLPGITGQAQTQIPSGIMRDPSTRNMQTISAVNANLPADSYLAQIQNQSGLMGSAPTNDISWLKKMNLMYGNNFANAINIGAGQLFDKDGNYIGNTQTEKARIGNQVKNIGSSFVSGAMKGGFKAGAGAAAGGIAALGGDLLAKGGQYIGNKRYGENITTEQNNVRSAVRSTMAAFGPIGWAIAAGTGAVDAIGAATGTELSNIDKDAAKRAGIRGVGVQNALNYLPGISTIPGAIGALNGIKRTDSFGMSDEAEEMAPAYAGTVNDMRAAEKLGNKRFLTRNQTNKAQGFVDSAKANNELLANLSVTNTMRKESDYAQNLAHQNLNRYAGENYLGMRAGREGIKLPTVEEIRAMRTRKLQAGGVIGIDSNILPEGSLHARLNHLDELNPNLEDATRKGIPVMAVEGGEIQEQVAEIEKEELILRLETTKKLEELMNDGSEEAMIEAGKLLAIEIMENTQDNTGQITEEVENGEQTK